MTTAATSSAHGATEGSATHEEVEQATARLRSDAALIRNALARLHHDEDEANQRYHAEVDHILTMMDHDLAIARAARAAERAETREALRETMVDVEGIGKELLEAFRVHVELGRMEIRDRWAVTSAPLQRAIDEVVDVVRRISSDAASDITGARDATRAAIAKLKTAAADIGRALTSPGRDAT